jgi:hypothetical protein
MTKPTITIVGGAEGSSEPPDPFRPENLVLDQQFTETVGVKKLLTSIPIRKPNKQTFFRIRPDEPGKSWRAMFPIIDFKDDGEEYVVVRDLVPELSTEIVHKQLCLGITRQGTLFFLPLRYPGPDGKDMEWWRSLREHAKRAETHWIRVIPNRELGAYECLQATDKLSEPEYPPGFEYFDLLKIALRDSLVDSLGHVVVKRLRGQV